MSSTRFSKRFAPAGRRVATRARRVIDALRAAPFDDLGFARVDTHRASSSGLSRGDPRHRQDAGSDCRHRRAHRRPRAQPARHARHSRGATTPCARWCRTPSITRRRGPSWRDAATSPPGTGTVLVVCAGTSDLPVAEEAAVTAEVMGNTVDRLYDVGVAGLHRLLQRARAAARRARRHRRRRHGRRAAERGRRAWCRRRSSPCRRASATAPASAASRRCSAC